MFCKKEKYNFYSIMVAHYHSLSFFDYLQNCLVATSMNTLFRVCSVNTGQKKEDKIIANIAVSQDDSDYRCTMCRKPIKWLQNLRHLHRK